MSCIYDKIMLFFFKTWTPRITFNNFIRFCSYCPEDLNNKSNYWCLTKISFYISIAFWVFFFLIQDFKATLIYAGTVRSLRKHIYFSLCLITMFGRLALNAPLTCFGKVHKIVTGLMCITGSVMCPYQILAIAFRKCCGVSKGCIT